jgi:hypothetical protein
VPSLSGLNSLIVPPALTCRAWSLYIFRGEVEAISTREAPLDAVFWLCIRARL